MNQEQIAQFKQGVASLPKPIALALMASLAGISQMEAGKALGVSHQAIAKRLALAWDFIFSVCDIRPTTPRGSELIGAFKQPSDRQVWVDDQKWNQRMERVADAALHEYRDETEKMRLREARFGWHPAKRVLAFADAVCESGFFVDMTDEDGTMRVRVDGCAWDAKFSKEDQALVRGYLRGALTRRDIRSAKGYAENEAAA